MEGEDFLEEPYSFGECRSYDFTTTAHCNAFETPDKEIHVSVRKRGDWVTVVIPDIISMNGGTKDDIITIDPFLSAELLGSNPRVRMFGGMGKNSAVYSNYNYEPANLVIELKNDGTVIIKPLQKFIIGNVAGTPYYNTTFIAKPKNGSNLVLDTIGSHSIRFTYVIDDNHKYDNTN